MKKIVLVSAFALLAAIGHAQCGTTYGQPTAGYNYGYTAGMNAADFQRAVEAVRHQTFDSDKQRIAEQVARGHQLSAVQVRELTELLTFESAKLEFAKFAYAYCIDQQNYYLVSDAFTFSSSKQALAEYTAGTGYGSGGTWTSANGGWSGGVTTTTTYSSSTSGGNCGTTGTNAYYGGGNTSGGYYGTTTTGNCGTTGTTGTNAYYGGGNTTSGGYYGTTTTGNCGTTGTNAYYGGGTTTGNCGTTGTNAYYGGGYVAPAPAPNCGACATYHDMSYFCESSFASILSAVERQTFESEKLSVAKQAIGSRWIGADQVRRLMAAFTFESSKLEFAKWAYSHCWDSQNYYVVNDAFTFSSSVRELDAFIRG